MCANMHAHAQLSPKVSKFDTLGEKKTQTITDTVSFRRTRWKDYFSPYPEKSAEYCP